MGSSGSFSLERVGLPFSGAIRRPYRYQVYDYSSAATLNVPSERDYVVGCPASPQRLERAAQSGGARSPGDSKLRYGDFTAPSESVHRIRWSRALSSLEI